MPRLPLPIHARAFFRRCLLSMPALATTIGSLIIVVVPPGSVWIIGWSGPGASLPDR